MSFETQHDKSGEREAEKLIQYVRLHLGEGDEDAGRQELERAWVAALKMAQSGAETDSEFISDTLCSRDPATLAHLFFHLHFYFSRRSGMSTCG